MVDSIAVAVVMVMGTMQTTRTTPPFRGQRPRQLLAQDQAPIAVVALGLEGLAQEQGGDDDADEEEDAGHQVGQQEGVGRKEPAVAKEGRVLRGGLGKEAAKGWAKDGADAPDEGHQGEGARLEFLLGHHFGHDGADDADYM